MMIWSNFSQSMDGQRCQSRGGKWSELFIALAKGSAQGPGVLFEVGERLLKALECIAHPALDGIFRRPGDVGDLLKGEVGDMPQQEDLALLVGESFDCRRDLELNLVAQGGAFGRGTRMQIGQLFA